MPRARLVGGCSATNGAFWVRGWPADYDAWAAAGNTGWSFARAVAAFRAVESDGDFSDGGTARTGPIPVARTESARARRVAAGVPRRRRGCGHPPVADHNRPGALGVGPLPRNVRDGTRMSTALTYLAPARPRPTLELRAGALVDRVLLTAAVRKGSSSPVVRSSKPTAWSSPPAPTAARRSCCAAGSARPGTFARSACRSSPTVPVWAPTSSTIRWSPSTCPPRPGPRTRLPGAAHACAPRCPAPTPRTCTCSWPGRSTTPSLPSGAVARDRHRAAVPPLARIAAAALGRPGRPAPDRPRLPAPSRRHGAEWSRPPGKRAGSAGPPPLADLVPGPEINPGHTVDDGDDVGLARSIRGRVSPYHHPVGTCAMGPDPDGPAPWSTHAVRVHGVDRLWVADASIMPTIPAANTNLPTIVVAERIAGWLTTG